MPDILKVLVLIGLSCHISFAQVVNVERLRLDAKSQGWSGSATGNVDVQRNQRAIFSMGTNSHVQHRLDSNTLLLVAKAGFVKISDARLVNYAFSHLRYTYYIAPFLSIEGFTQLQQNRVNGIASRWLLGTGPRFRFLQSRVSDATLGVMVFREREREVDDSVPVRKHVRISTYLAGSYTPTSADYITFSNTTYFQPRIGKFSDIRISSDWDLAVSLKKNLKLVTTFNIVYDSEPPLGLDQTVYALKNGLRFTFG